jgi:hypothetical protein
MPGCTPIFRIKRHIISLNCLALLCVVSILAFAPSISIVWAAAPVAVRHTAPQTQPEVAPGRIGNSGYVVPVPEIKIKSIIGNQPLKKPEPETRPVKKTTPVERPSAKEPPASPESEPEFDQPPPSAKSSVVAPAKKRGPVIGPREEVPVQEQVNRLPFDPAYSTGTGTTKSHGEDIHNQNMKRPVVPASDQLPSRHLDRSGVQPAVEAVPKKRPEIPVASSRGASEKTIKPPPIKKEVLMKGEVIVRGPKLLVAIPVKEASKTSPLERMTVDLGESAVEGISLAKRAQPEALPTESVQSPKKLANLSPPETAVPEPAPKPAPPEPPRTESPVSKPKATAPPVKHALPEVAKETPSEPVQPPKKPANLGPPAPNIPSVKKPSPPPRVRIVSPLDRDALQSREAKDYLTRISPILGELSLLMARAPSLVIADFDPSDPNAMIFPKEIYVKIDSMKRELQILDSKAFAIIPPKKYATFHSMIRKSITQTYQACDALINYFNERSDENLRNMRDHLMKARELIRSTRPAQS